MADSSERATADSAFFTVLPPEVRIFILTEALRGRTIHIQPCNAARLQPQPQVTRSRKVVGNAKKWLGGLLAAKTKDKEGTRPARRQVQWCGRVCCNLADDSPAQDDCLGNQRQGQQRTWCSCGGRPTLAIGALGWLLTCRKASHNDYVALAGTDESEAVVLKRTLSRVPNLMPSLQKFYIGFCLHTCPIDKCEYGDALNYECTKYLTGLVGAMAREFAQMGRSCELELGLPSTPFERYQHEALMQRCRIGSPAWMPGMAGRFFYYPRVRVFWPAHDGGSDPGPGKNESGGLGVGFWMSMAQYDGLPWCRFQINDL